MAYTIAFFGTKPYDESSFTDKNKEFGFEIRYYKGHLNKNNVLLTQAVDAVSIFVNDVADAEVFHVMAANGVKLLGLRCAGFNNVDLEEAKKKKISREEYMRILLTHAALMPEVKSIDEKYQILVHELMGRLKYQNDILERAIEIIEAEK